jgi:uncharacterized protein YutD
MRFDRIAIEKFKYLVDEFGFEQVRTQGDNGGEVAWANPSIGVGITVEYMQF